MSPDAINLSDVTVVLTATNLAGAGSVKSWLRETV